MERKRANQIHDNEKEKSKRTNYVWKKGDKCLIVTKTNKQGGKLPDYENQGPYEIMKVNNNGTVKIKCDNFEETINICWLDLYYERQNKPDQD